jgi:hypothetical protein
LLIGQFLSPCVPSLGSLWIVTHAEDFLANSDEIADAKLLAGSRVNARWVIPVARLPRHAPSLSWSVTDRRAPDGTLRCPTWGALRGIAAALGVSMAELAELAERGGEVKWARSLIFITPSSGWLQPKS